MAERPRWEEFLAAAEIIAQEQMHSRNAVTEPWVLTLRQGEVTRQALWKNPEGRRKGVLEGWKFEIAAYRLDKHLGLNMVPPTVERRFQGERGSCQLWVESEMDLREKVTKNIQTPPEFLLGWAHAAWLQQAFDNLIGNEDRHAGNLRITKDWRSILIDHSRSFRTGARFTKQLYFRDPDIANTVVMRQLPKAFVEKIRALDASLIRTVVAEYLTDKEIEAVLARRDLLLREFDLRVKEFGPDNFFY